MSESQFDDLLGDFGGSSTTTTTTTTKTSSNGAFDDNFDPFGPSSDATPASNGGGDNSELLLDFSTSAEVKNGESNNGVELQFETSASDSANPLYDMSADTQSSNPLYDMSSGSGNPLYDLSTEGDTNQSSNPLYEFSAETTTSDSTNPLYEFEDIGTTNDTAQDADLISGTNDDDDGSFQTSEPQTNYGDLLGDIGDGDGNQNTNESGPGEEIHFEVTEPVVMNGNPKDWFGEVPREEEPVQQEEDEDVEEEQLQDYSERVEVVEEAEAGQEVQEEEEQPPPQPVIPTVEITQTPSVSEAPEGEEENLPDLVVREEGDVYDDENAAAGGGEEFESGPMEASGSQGDSLTAEASFGHDRREEDLEQYCMDREESDLVDASEEQEHGLNAQPMASLKAREERSRSPSRSIGPDTPEESHVDVTPEDTDATEEMDTLRPRGDRSHAPSRSLEPEDRKPKEEEIIEDGRTVSKTTRTENRYSGSGFEEPQVSSNQWEEERNRQNADYDRQAGKEEISHFSEMSSVKDKFESGPTAAPRKQQFDYQQEVQSSEGGVYESEPQAFQQWQNEEEEEEGVYENQPQKRDDVVREADTDRGADLPAVGTAQNIRAKFLSGAQQEAPRSKREITPPAHGAGGEYVSEPRGYVEKYEGKAEAGVFESQPATHNPDVVTSTTEVEEARYQSGFAKSTAARFREMGSNQSYTPSGKREITPDRTGRVEYVSEPRGQGVERYEGKAESGVFESEPVLNPDVVRSGQETEEQLPEQGMARNIASKFRQISSEGQTYTPRGKREITPDRTGRVEYVSEPRGQTETYETEEYVPEKGFARNVAAKFRELESTAKSPPLSPGRRKEFTPPREEERARQSVVLESNPDFKDDVVHSGDQLEEKLPERGTAKNIAQRFRQMEAESRSPKSPKEKKEFTPPPQDYGGVYENQPKQFQADYNRPAESGIIENEPVRRDDVVRGDEPPRYEQELPERGAAKNLVSRWRQMESESAKAKSPGSRDRVKEFTPPREEPRIAEQRKSPRTPMSPTGVNDMGNGSVHPSELPGQYQPQNEPSIFESNPEQRADVIREADTDWTEGMPKRDTAKKMLAKFQHIQAEASKQQPMPVSRKEPEPKRRTPRKVGRSKSMRAAIQTEKCGACEKTVYAMERLEMNKQVYHKACFRCTQCKAVLTPKTFAINNGVIFCTTHYKQLFATKGNYDEGFGRMQHKKRWSSNPNLAAKDGEGDESQEAVQS